VKLYGFDEIDERLELVPLAARRALDHTGLKLSLSGWQSLPQDARRAIASAGSAKTVDAARVRASVQGASPAAAELAPVMDPPSEEPPPELVKAFGSERPLSAALWAGLSSLDRYVLAKVATRANAGRIARAYEEIVGASAVSTHLAPRGGVRMIDVSEKQPTLRRATAETRVSLNAEAMQRLARADTPKGDVLGTARLAGILAAKRTADLIPLCHPLRLSHVAVALELEPEESSVRIEARVEAIDRTGVEMEALVAASIAALTVYDMLKAVDRSMQIGPTRLVEKSGGRSGDFRR
jgi:cyclic pyranopterin phosphate synthase